MPKMSAVVRRSAGSIGALTGLLLAAIATPAAAQQMPFERTYEVGANAVLDVSTERGRIEVTGGETDRVTVTGTATVRIGWNVPANAVDIARRVAANPPVEQDGSTLRLRPPSTDEERRAVTIAYRVTVPRGMAVKTQSDSGATTVSGVAGDVSIRTQSAAIAVRDLGGSADVASGSGAVDVSGVSRELRVSTGSSAITLRKLGAGLSARTQSGAVRAWFVGEGKVEVETGSSAIDLDGVRGGLTVSSSSGHMRISGSPLSPWRVVTGSGGVDLTFARDAKMTFDVDSGSGKAYVDGLTIAGSSTDRRISGTVSGGGALVRVSSRSGSVKIR
jgi:Putative adhesin